MVVMCGSTVTALLFLSRFEAKVQFLEKLTEYSFEVQQARRFEKNFFLYGTNLQDALENVQAASDHLARNADDVRRVAGERAYRTMEENLGHYQETLEETRTAVEKTWVYYDCGHGKPAGERAGRAE
jgi:two-component system NtrC family sensor kinase